MGTVSSTGNGTARRRRRGRSHPGLPSSSSGGSGERQDTGEWGQSQVVGEKGRAKNYEFKVSLLKLLKSLNSGLPAAQKRYISATIPRTQDTKIHGKRRKGLL